MPIFKLWNSTRTNKKFLIAASLDELIQKGAMKLNLPTDDETELCICLEEDGTLIDEDEILKEVGDKTLLLKPRAELWVTAFEEHPTTQYNEPNETCADKANESFASSDANHQDLSCQPLPTFSPMVLKHIDSDPKSTIPERIWSILISETAEYYYGIIPDIKDQQDYKIIGSKMFKRYPCIRFEGQHPWSAFNKCLSQKIRHIRHNLKAKSRTILDGINNTASAAKKPCLVYKYNVNNEVDEVQDLERHKLELSKEWEKPKKNRNTQHMQMLVTKTRADRLQIVSKNGRIMNNIITEYPCFKDGQFILQDFIAAYGKQQVKTMSNNLKALQVAVEEMAGFNSTDDEKSPMRMFSVIKFIESQTHLHQGKNTKPKTIIEEKKDIPDSELDSAIQTRPMDGPRIILLTSDNNIKGIFVCGDDQTVEINKEGGIITAIFKLLAMYYIFDLEYPRAYSMVMGILQTYVIGEVYPASKTSKRYKIFNKELKYRFEDVLESCNES